MKYSKIVEALGRILYLTGKQWLSYRYSQEKAASSDSFWNPGNFLAIFRQVIFLYKSNKSKWIDWHCRKIHHCIIQKWLIEEIKEVKYRFISADEVAGVYVYLYICIYVWVYMYKCVYVHVYNTWIQLCWLCYYLDWCFEPLLSDGNKKLNILAQKHFRTFWKNIFT